MKPERSARNYRRAVCGVAISLELSELSVQHLMERPGLELGSSELFSAPCFRSFVLSLGIEKGVLLVRLLDS